MRTKYRQLITLIIATVGLFGLTAKAGDVLFDFDSDPAGLIATSGNATWRPTGGNGDPTLSGYLSITDAANGQFGKIIFDDIDDGKVVAAFTFDVDLRTGGGTTPPADGYSVNFARAGDPVLTGDVFAPSPNGAEASLPEEGTRTGISVCLDQWDSGAPDVVGITVRVDGKIVFDKRYPNQNGNLDDLTSLETGPAGQPLDGINDVPGLGWAHLKVVVKEGGALTVSYKGEEILTDFASGFFPSAGRIVFAGRTGGANSHHHADNIHLVTVGAEKAVIGSATGDAFTFKLTVDDSGDSVLDAAGAGAATFKLDGNSVTPASFDKVGGTTTFRFNSANRLDAGSTHDLEASFKDVQNRTITGTRPFTVPGYALVPSAWKAASVVDADTGWRARMNQISIGRYPGDANRTLNAERQLADGYLDPANPGNPYPNLIDVASFPPDEEPNVYFLPVVNFDQAAAAQGNFGGETLVPGLASGDPNNIAGEFTAYLELKRGSYTLGVNSDDGFRASFGRGLSDLFGVQAGEFDGGRGASDTTFAIAVEEDGFYPFRVSWWEGGGGANGEIFSVDPVTGQKILIGDLNNEASIKAFRTGVAKSYVRSAVPAPNQYGGAIAETPIVVTIVDGAAPVAGVVMTLDGVTVIPDTSKDGSITTLRVEAPAEGWNPGDHVVSVTFDGNTYHWPFNVSRLPAGRSNFLVEAEDFNHDGGAAEAIANTMPYDGGAYAGLGAVTGVDYNNGDGNDSDQYRAGESPNVNLDPNTGGAADEARANRGGWNVTTSFKMGWVGGGDWENYTRTVPAGVYMVAAGLSFDGGAPKIGQDPANDNALNSVFSVVTSDPGQPCQTLFNIGSSSHRHTGGWGINNLVPMTDAAGNLAYFRSDGTEKTFRMAHGSGDFDYFAFVPVSGALPPTLSGGSLRNGGVSQPAGPLRWSIANRATTVDKGTLVLKIDSTVVTPTVTDSAVSGLGVNVSYSPATAFAKDSVHTFELSFKDSAGALQTFSGSFTASVVDFYVEAEDFDYDGGKHKPEASVMPYYGGAYNALGAIHDVDYHNDDGNDSNVYRCGENPNTNITGQGDTGRSGWTMVENYRIGWIGGAGEFFNYTRNFPTGDYTVTAALSFDGRDPGQLHGTLQKVDPATVGMPRASQVRTDLGVFDAPGSGGWGANNYVPLKHADGSLAVVHLSGVETISYNSNSGDYDYLKFTPVVAAAPRITSITRNADNTVTVVWEGACELQVSDNVDGPYVTVQGATSPLIAPIDRVKRFARLRCP